ncbi:hypothetical protein BB561_004747 [Smittium simulii]|uniref:Uncharacterized protein n=1 Tax=Smittium simulii TaxID=133385 RepID=A0A2T9YEH5_9FUNG|nr:hypothetical protein BB561_004747 [Smittium simulii]
MVPWEIEKLMVLGMAICTNALLKVFVDLPADCFITLKSIIKMMWFKIAFALNFTSKQHNSLDYRSWTFSTQLAQVYKFIIIIISLIILSGIDSSRAYHIIRAQSALKLYFIFSSLELIDKLCASFGLDVIDSLEYSIFQALQDHESYNTKLTSFVYASIHGVLALLYMIIHSSVLYIQVLSLNAAANSHSQQLLSLLISNQFVELKGNILKKFEKENFFQLTCGDITERFQQSVFMMLIFIQNLFELTNSEIILPSETSYFKYLFSLVSEKFIPFSLLADRVILPIFMVIGTEMLVDWIKHAFIAKYNWFRPQLYSRYADILCRDLVGATPEEDSIYAEAFLNTVFFHTH